MSGCPCLRAWARKCRLGGCALWARVLYAVLLSRAACGTCLYVRRYVTAASRGEPWLGFGCLADIMVARRVAGRDGVSLQAALLMSSRRLVAQRAECIEGARLGIDGGSCVLDGPFLADFRAYFGPLSTTVRGTCWMDHFEGPAWLSRVPACISVRCHRRGGRGFTAPPAPWRRRRRPDGPRGQRASPSVIWRRAGTAG